jgi:Flp pilus assembly protein TadB
VRTNLSISEKRKIAVIAFTCVVVFGMAAIPFFGFYSALLGPVPLLMGVGFALGYYCRATSRAQKKRRDEIKKMEEELPDALFKLGSRIAEGEPLETALMKVSESMKGSNISELLERISYTIKVTRSTPREAMFGPDLGVLRDLPSRTINATMKTVIACVEKDAQTAGGIIINISNYQRDMKKVEHDIKTSLRQTVEMMKSTGVLFAPLVMGITASLYVLLSREFAMLPGSTQLLSNELFFLVIGIYLILMVIITIYFSVGIEHGEDRIELKHSIGNAVPVAVIVYAAALVAGQVMIG